MKCFPDLKHTRMQAHVCVYACFCVKAGRGTGNEATFLKPLGIGHYN